MEPNRINIYTDTTYTHVDRQLGPMTNKAWKIEIRKAETTGEVGKIEIQRDTITVETFYTPGTGPTEGSTGTQDINNSAGGDVDIWILNGEYILNWTDMDQVKVFEYNAFNQQISNSILTGKFEYAINNKDWTDHPAVMDYNPNIELKMSDVGWRGHIYGPPISAFEFAVMSPPEKMEYLNPWMGYFGAMNFTLVSNGQYIPLTADQGIRTAAQNFMGPKLPLLMDFVDLHELHIVCLTDPSKSRLLAQTTHYHGNPAIGGYSFAAISGQTSMAWPGGDGIPAPEEYSGLANLSPTVMDLVLEEGFDELSGASGMADLFEGPSGPNDDGSEVFHFVMDVSMKDEMVTCESMIMGVCPDDLVTYMGATTGAVGPNFSNTFTDLKLYFVAISGTKYEINPNTISSEYYDYNANDEQPYTGDFHIQKLLINWIDYAPVAALEEWNYSYCHSNEGAFVSLHNKPSCENNGDIWHYGHNNFEAEYEDGSTGGFTSKTFVTGILGQVGGNVVASSAFSRANTRFVMKKAANKSIARDGVKKFRQKFE